VTLARSGIRVELTSALRASMARLTFPQTGQANVVFDPSRSIGGTKDGHIDVTSDRTLSGWTRSGDGYKLFFDVAFDRPFASQQAMGAATAVTFDATSDRTVGMRTAISYVDAGGAAGNLAAEAPAGLTFDAMREQARAAWNSRLHGIDTSRGQADLRKTFYSNLYRFFLMPSVFDDADGRYLGMDNIVRSVAPGTHHYTALSLWDTYRTEFPLLSLIEPGVAHDVAISILDDGDQNGGMLPRWVQANRDQQIMGGDSATATLGDAVGEGVLSDAETQRAYAAMLHNATTLPATSSREGLPGYLARGWVGQDETGRSGAALTLEYAIDDAAMLPAARRFGTPGEIASLRGRAGFWENLMNTDSGFLQPRNKNGSWARPGPLEALGAPWRPEFQDGWQEGTGYQYLWFAPQDVPGLASAMGGADVARRRLDDFFRAPAPVQDRGSFYGVYYIGTQYTPGNETDLWVPWYYDWLAQPWKTQNEVREAMSVFSWRPDGMPGNDDTGTMSAWYVLAALGVYHAAPGSEAWELSSPAFERAIVHTGGARALTIAAHGASWLRRYVQSATLGRRPFSRTWLPSSTMHGGGALRFEMGARPNESWGTGRGAAPPSLSGSR
jgi:predicted alpha-1,2-mannosidase